MAETEAPLDGAPLAQTPAFYSAPVAPQGRKKRRRPALSCEQCRKRKIRCDRLQPCNHCVRSNITDCHYVPTHVPASWAKKAQQAAVTEQHAAIGLAPADPSPAPRVLLPTPSVSSSELGAAQPFCMIQLMGRIPTAPRVSPDAKDLMSVSAKDWAASMHFLEDKLDAVSISNTGSPSSHRDEDRSGSTRANAAKTTYYGPSHWLRSTSLLMAEKDLFVQLKANDGEFWYMMDSCKKLGRVIKEKRTSPLSSLELGRRIPSRDIADALVDIYLRNFEGVLRILHVPTFRAEYERYWAAEGGERTTPSSSSNYGSSSQPDSFIIQLQLVMAIGSAVQDDTFSLRALASQWFHEAQLWLMLPPEKSRLTVAGIQVLCLVTLARSVCSVGAEFAWITSGELIRKAMYMGLHLDPRKLQPAMSNYRVEMRRRLWVTVMELNLQSSFDAGGPALITPTDYDVLPPANLDDEELEDEPSGEAGQSPADSDTTTTDGVKVTQMSIPLELLRSFPLRLALLNHVNGDRGENDYQKTLYFNSSLTKLCRTLSQNLPKLVRAQKDKATTTTTSSSTKINDFQINLAELLVYRCFTTLHQPFVLRSLDDPRLYFSRKMYLDGAIKIATICDLAGPGRASGPGGEGPGAGASDFQKLMTTGGGIFRNILLQAIPGIIFELTVSTGGHDDGGIRNSSGEGGGRGGGGGGGGLGYFHSVGDHNLHGMVDASVRWMARRMKAGETNIKGYLASGVGRRHVAALEAGMDRDGVKAACRSAASEILRECYQILKEVAAREGIQVDDSHGPGEDSCSGKACAAETVADEQKDEDDLMGIDLLGDWVWDGMDDGLWTYPTLQNGPSVFG